MNAISIALDHVGGPTKLAAILSVSAQAVCFWRDGQRKIPAERCPLIEEATGGLVRCEDLRPDVRWDVLRSPRGLVGNLQPNPPPALMPPAQAATESVAGVAHV